MTTTTSRSHDAQPYETVAPGVEFCFLRRHDGPSAGLTLLVRMAKGAHARHHGHPGGEEVYLVSGKLRVGSRLLAPGDYLWTAPGEAHDGFAEEESVFFTVLPGGLDLAAQAPPADERPALRPSRPRRFDEGAWLAAYSSRLLGPPAR